MDPRVRNIFLLICGFILILFFIVAGIDIWNNKGYDFSGVVYFSILGLIEIIIIVCLIYNIYKKIKENQNCTPLDTTGDPDPYSSS